MASVAERIEPTLKAGLVELCKTRPDDPRTWLANWLIANKPPPQLQPAGDELIAELVALAAEPITLDPDDEYAGLEPLNEARMLLVRKLYDACDAADGVAGDDIILARLKTATVQCGPFTLCPMSEFSKMDTSKDGVVTLAEVVEYFTYVGQTMGETDFEYLVESIMRGVTQA